MSQKKKFTVHRAMHGDGKDYARGDTREMTESDAADLVKSGALALEGDEPATRTAAVKHTFGTRESEVNRTGYTTASGEGVTPPKAATGSKAKA